MTAILRRLQSNVVDFPASCVTGMKEWSFTDQMKGKDEIFFHKLVENHNLLSFEYNVHCAQLVQDLHADSGQLARHLEEALMMAELLEHIYFYYLNVPREALRLRRDQLIYRDLLMREGYQFTPNPQSTQYDESSVSRTVRELTANANWPRLFVVRLRRLMVAGLPLAEDLSTYRRGVLNIDKFAAPALSYLAWIFFTPRLLTNLILIGKHVIPGRWMSSEEQKLGWQTRFKIQWQSRWFELGNDTVWLISGLMNCFVLVGALAPVAIYMSVCLQGYDILLSSIRACIEINRMNKLQADYHAMLQDASLSEEERTDIGMHITQLKLNTAHEKKRLYLSVINNCVLFLSVSLALPIFAFNPLIPLIGAILAVLTTIVCYESIKYIEKQRPTSNVKLLQDERAPSSGVADLGLFGRPRSLPDDTTTITDAASVASPSGSNASPS